jgi:hypothetical protein
MASPVRGMTEIGLGTVESSEASLASTGLPSLPATAESVLITPVSGTLYIEFDGGACTAADTPIIGPLKIESDREEIVKIRIYAAGAYDYRFAYFRRKE